MRAFLGPLILFLSGDLQAQEVSPFLGTKTPYHPQQRQYTPPPAGFKPMFVNYVGRHGARFMTKAGTEERVLQALRPAESHSLTPLGLQIKRIVERLSDIEKGNYELISLLGKEEQAAIGERTWNGYRDAFRGRGLDVVTTYKVRTQQSAEAFLKGFAKYNGKKRVTMRPDSVDTVLRFYDLSAAYQRYKKSAAVKMPVDTLERDGRNREVAANICSKIFTPAFSSVKLDSVAFAGDLYDLYCLQFSLLREIGKNEYAKSSVEFGSVFGKKDLEWLDFVSGAQDFLEKGPAADALGIQVKIAVPLLADFLGTMQAAIDQKGNVDAVLRFTHAEAISPFASLLGIPEASVPAAGIYQYRKHWLAGGVIPLSANIQWVLYSDGKEYLVKALLNEKEVSLPLATTRYPYYRWQDVRDHYRELIQRLEAEK